MWNLPYDEFSYWRSSSTIHECQLPEFPRDYRHAAFEVVYWIRWGQTDAADKGERPIVLIRKVCVLQRVNLQID